MKLPLRVVLEARHLFTGRTLHTTGGVPMPRPHSLLIDSLEGGPGFYLFYLDANGEEMNDTYHDSIEQAMEQAEWEFGVMEGDWTSNWAR